MIIIELLVILLVLVVYILMSMPMILQQRSCKHDGGVNETRSCNAICKLCGKNLGFIGTEENKIRRGQ